MNSQSNGGKNHKRNEGNNTGTSNQFQTSQFPREFNRKSTNSGNAKTIPSYAQNNIDTMNIPKAEAEILTFQKKVDFEQKQSLEGENNAKSPSHKKKELIDIRKDKNFPDKINTKIKAPPKKEPQTPQPIKPTRPAVSFGVKPSLPKEAFRPPTPIPFMHRVNSLPYVAQIDTDPFEVPQVIEPFYPMGDDNTTTVYEGTTFETIPSRPDTPVDNAISPLLIAPPPPIDMSNPSPLFMSSASSREMSPSLMERSLSPVFIQQAKPKKKNNYWWIIIIVLAVLINIYLFG